MDEKEIIKNANEIIYNAECWIDDEEYTGTEELEWAKFEKNTVQGLLDLYNKEKEKNKNLIDTNKELYEIKYIASRFINRSMKQFSIGEFKYKVNKFIEWEDKIKEKIEKLQSELKYIGCENKDDIGDKSCKKCFNSYRGANFVYCYAYHQIKVLKKLLEEME